MLNLDETQIETLKQKRYIHPQVHIVDLCEDIVRCSGGCTPDGGCDVDTENTQSLTNCVEDVLVNITFS